jgi:hypothetical protein
MTTIHDISVWSMFSEGESISIISNYILNLLPMFF